VSSTPPPTTKASNSPTPFLVVRARHPLLDLYLSMPIMLTDASE
jgi:hypothetical protein